MSDSNGLLFVIVTFACIVLFIGGIGGTILFVVIRSSKAVNRGWGDLAKRLGLTFKPVGILGSPELNGDFRQRPIRLYTYDAGGPGHHSIYTAVAVTVKNPGNSAMEITPSGTVGNFLGKIVKAQDVDVGNPAFDDRFTVKSSPPEFAVKALGEARLQSLIMDLQGLFRIELQGSSLEYSTSGTQANADFLAKMFNTLSDLADRIEQLR